MKIKHTILLNEAFYSTTIDPCHTRCRTEVRVAHDKQRFLISNKRHAQQNNHLNTSGQTVE